MTRKLIRDPASTCTVLLWMYLCTRLVLKRGNATASRGREGPAMLP